MDDLIEILALIFVLGIPSVALATHLVFRPLLRDIAHAIRSESAKPDADPEIEHRLARLEAACDRLEDQVGRLVEVERFHRELETARETEPRARPRESRQTERGDN